MYYEEDTKQSNQFQPQLSVKTVLIYWYLMISLQKTESSIIQTFVLPPGERLIAMFQHSETVESIIKEDPPDPSQTLTSSGGSHTVDGMILVTTSGVFQCQPRTSPEKLFLELAVNSSDTSAADVLAITSGLDVNRLYEVDTSLKTSLLTHGRKKNPGSIAQGK